MPAIQKRTIECIFRNRLYLRKGKPVHIIQRKNILNYKKLLNWWLPLQRRDKEEYPGSSNYIYVLSLKLGDKNTEASYTFFLRMHRNSTRYVKHWVISFNSANHFKKTSAPFYRGRNRGSEEAKVWTQCDFKAQILSIILVISPEYQS